MVDGNAVVLEDDLVEKLKCGRFQSVPSVVPHCNTKVAAAFCLNWRLYDA